MSISNFGWNGQAICLDVWSNFVYCSFLYLTITWHVFINIFQMEHFLAVKFGMAYEKNMSFLEVPKSPKVKKKLKK